jgi:hypothetical protein
MRLLITLIVCSTLLVTIIPAKAQQLSPSSQNNPYEKLATALNLIEHLSLSEVRDEIAGRTKQPCQTSEECLLIAELMKRVGDARTESHYERAISLDRTEPAYELFYADYLRNFRGPQRPLFPRSEQHYLRALERLEQRKQENDKKGWDENTKRRVQRGLVALYQEDGPPLFYRNTDEAASVQLPVAFFSTINKAAQLTGDFDNNDDVRALTSEALLSAQRRLSALSDAQLKGMIRAKNQFETLDRIRFRYGNWPVLDVFYKFRAIEQAQITMFEQPNIFNNFDLKEYGVALEKPFSISRNFDVYLRGAYKRIARRGLIENRPDGVENVNEYEAKVALSRFFGPDKAVLEAVYVFQDINQQINNPNKRERRITAATFTYQLLRLQFQSIYKKRFETRGLHFFGGFADDQEKFATVVVHKDDYFAGASLRGVGGFDLTVQPTFFTAYVDGDISRRENSQYRTNANLLYRIRDEEREPEVSEKVTWLHPAFIHLVVPFKHDLALKGLEKFENYRFGIELHTKLYSVNLGGASILASCGYNYQQFYRLNKTLHLFNFSLDVGY